MKIMKALSFIIHSWRKTLGFIWVLSKSPLMIFISININLMTFETFSNSSVENDFQRRHPSFDDDVNFFSMTLSIDPFLPVSDVTTFI